MNELIKELWEDSTSSCWPKPGKFTAGEYDYNLEAFAKTIMDKCAVACSHSSCGKENSAEDLINKYFGV